MTAVKKAAATKQVKVVAAAAANGPTLSAELAQLLERRNHYFSVLRHALDEVEKAGKTAHGAVDGFVIRYGELYRDANHYVRYFPAAESLQRLLRKEKRDVAVLSQQDAGWAPIPAITAAVKLELKNAAIKSKNDAADKRRIRANVKAIAKVRAEKAKAKK